MEKLKWMQPEIDNMKHLYVNNYSIKTIASLLNRTPTSVNKALSRFGVRPIKNALPQPTTLTMNELSFEFQTMLQKNNEEDKWVSLKFVQYWLQSKGYNVTPRLCPFKNQMEYFIDEVCHTAGTLVLFFNKKRLDENLEICFVEDVSC